MITEVAPDIFRIGQKKRSWIAPFSVNVYVIAGEDGLVFDAGLGGRKACDRMVSQIRDIEALMEQRGKPCRITRLLVSHGHWDHFSGAAGLRDRLGLRILANSRTARTMASRKNYRRSFRGETALIHDGRSWFFRTCAALGQYILDTLFFQAFRVRFVPGPVETVSDRQILTIGDSAWELRLMPGHCDDDMVLVNHEQGVLLCGDIVLRAVNTWLGPPRSNLANYMKSLELIAAIPGLRLILPAHGSPVTEPYKRLREASEHRKKRTLELLRFIQKKGKKGAAFDHIFHNFYPALGYTERIIARGWILVTLMDLMERGLIVTEIVKKKKIFRACP